VRLSQALPHPTLGITFLHMELDESIKCLIVFGGRNPDPILCALNGLAELFGFLFSSHRFPVFTARAVQLGIHFS
jgi:hypothetical protein